MIERKKDLVIESSTFRVRVNKVTEAGVEYTFEPAKGEFEKTFDKEDAKKAIDYAIESLEKQDVVNVEIRFDTILFARIDRTETGLFSSISYDGKQLDLKTVEEKLKYALVNLQTK